MIAFSCPECGMKFSVKPEFAGRTTRCPTCKHPLVVPTPAPVEATLALGKGRPLDGALSSMAKAALGGGVTLDFAHEAAPRRQEIHDLLARRTGEQGKYVVEAEIARGGMGAVLRALDCDIRREVAVKYMLDQSDAESKLRFIKEAQITGQLEHPNIVPIHELGVDGQQRVFFSMKMVKGRSLAQVLEVVEKDPAGAGKEFTLTRLLTFFVNVCHALAYAHARGVVHRDLKPANIMIGDFGEVYVMDWGLAKVLKEDRATAAPLIAPTLQGNLERLPGADQTVLAPGAAKVVVGEILDSELTQEGSILGTPVYMPPEQAAGLVQAIDERSDVYSLGAILYQILTLRTPVDKEGGHRAVLDRVLQGKIFPPALRNPERAREGIIPPELAAISLKALSAAPAARYQEVAALRRDVELFVEGRSVSAKEDSRREVLLKFIKRNKALSAAVAAATILLAVVITVALSINLQARRDVEQAYKAYEHEQKEKEARTRQAVPALVKIAQLDVEQGRLAEALKQTTLALEYDIADPPGNLLQGQLLVARQDFSRAARHLENYCRQKPKDFFARELQQLCQTTRKDDEDKSNVVEMAQILSMQKLPRLAEELLKQHGASGDAVRQNLLELYRQRLEEAWKGGGTNLTLDQQGFHLSLSNNLPVRDLQPLQSLPLRSLHLDCPAVRDLTPLAGMPLEVFMSKCQVTNLAALKDAPLTAVHLDSCTLLTDISALANRPLKTLTIDKCSGVRDWQALSGLPLESMHIRSCSGLQSLAFLKGAALTSLEIANCTGVSDLSPLAGAPLAKLSLTDCPLVDDLTPLSTLPLTQVNLSGNVLVRDLTPLRGLPLTRLQLKSCRALSNLTGLNGLPLNFLDLSDCSKLEDLTPLRKMPLLNLDLRGTAIKDLGPLEGMPLTSVLLSRCVHLTDLGGIKGLPLIQLDLEGCVKLADLSPLKKMPLNTLNLSGCKEVRDLTPLAGMPLNTLVLDGCANITDLTPLRDAVLVQIDLTGCAGLTSLRGLENMRFAALGLTDCTGLRSLEGLKGGQLKSLVVSDALNLDSLAGLAGLPLQTLTLKNCPKLADLSGLKGLPLTKLILTRCDQVTDLSALAGLKLVEIQFPATITQGMAALRAMTSLQTINNQPAEKFWKDYDNKGPGATK